MLRADVRTPWRAPAGSWISWGLSRLTELTFRPIALRLEFGIEVSDLSLEHVRNADLGSSSTWFAKGGYGLKGCQPPDNVNDLYGVGDIE